MLALIVPPVISLIIKGGGISEEQAVLNFYRSKLYAELSDESSKLWHYGPATLYSMYTQELRTGSYEYPEEA